MNEVVKFVHVEAGPLLEDIRSLFLEYAGSLNFELCFQSFDEELRELPGKYAAPAGRLILCQWNGATAGCIALKPLEQDVCEMKRLYVKPEFRGRHLGMNLAKHTLHEARAIGYKSMRLDTIRGYMDNAIALYRSLGFKEIPPYYHNPIPNAVFLELSL